VTKPLRPFFSYYGAKYRSGARYPAPTHTTIVEPFAGSAGYALRHHTHDVVLVERYHHVAEIWRWLINATPDSVLSLPVDVADADTVDAPDGARWLIGFWLSRGGAHPVRTPSAWMREKRWPGCFWGTRIRQRIASQVDAIRHWTIIEASYESAPDIAATWFVDPPYDCRAGRRYVQNTIDYQQLARWCRSRRGQTIVCEGLGATWLPFRDTIGDTKVMGGGNRRGTFREVVWTADTHA
jgi:hypothetical protein